MKKLLKIMFLSAVVILTSACTTRHKFPEQACPLPAAKDRPQYKISKKPKHVVILSIDGLGRILLNDSDAPFIKSLARKGSYASRARTIPLSLTLPSHTSMLTGLAFESHKVDWNHYEKKYSEIALPNIFDWARSKGLKTAALFGKEKFYYLTGTKKPNSRVDVNTLDLGEIKSFSSNAVKLLKDRRPHLSFIHYRHVDYLGHGIHWHSDIQKQAVTEIDVALRSIVATLDRLFPKNYALIVTADHGGHGKRHGSCLSSDIFIPWIAYGPGVIRKNHISEPMDTYDTAVTAAFLLGLETPSQVDGVSVFKK